MSASLVGSEMCIRDSLRKRLRQRLRAAWSVEIDEELAQAVERCWGRDNCLLYTSDAADDM
eukprot:8442967-Alexandrium_andersonii.AAC.1